MYLLCFFFFFLFQSKSAYDRWESKFRVRQLRHTPSMDNKNDNKNNNNSNNKALAVAAGQPQRPGSAAVSATESGREEFWKKFAELEPIKPELKMEFSFPSEGCSSHSVAIDVSGGGAEDEMMLEDKIRQDILRKLRSPPPLFFYFF